MTTGSDSPPQNDGGRPPKATAEQVLEALQSIDGPAFTSEVATELNVSTRTARRHLTALADAGVIHHKAPNQTAIWWCPDNPYDRLDDAALDNTE